jgi:hypothetical protein
MQQVDVPMALQVNHGVNNAQPILTTLCPCTFKERGQLYSKATFPLYFNPRRRPYVIKSNPWFYATPQVAYHF